MAEVSYSSKSKSKVQLKFFFSIENTEIKYDWGFNLFKMLK